MNLKSPSLFLRRIQLTSLSSHKVRSHSTLTIFARGFRKTVFLLSQITHELKGKHSKIVTSKLKDTITAIKTYPIRKFFTNDRPNIPLDEILIAQTFYKLISKQQHYDPASTIHICTDASEADDHFSVAFHSPHPEIQYNLISSI